MQDMASSFTTHGGALDLAERCFPAAPRPWLDLSTGINPAPYPVPSLATQAWTALPAARDLALLEATAARRYGVPAHAFIVAAPGTQAIIQRLPTLCPGRDVRVLGPSYGEFERVFRAEGVPRRFPTIDGLVGADIAVVVNPNNPDGRVTPAADLLELAKRVGTLVVDEAFIEAAPAAVSVVPNLLAERMIVLRSFGKCYGLAGIRLGFAIASPEREARLREHLGPWAVSGPAIAVGTAALADATWLGTTQVRLAADMARLTFLLRGIGAEPVGGTGLFLLIAHPRADRLFASLAQDGILTRPFADAPNWLRFGLPGPEADWIRLESALRRFAR